MIAQIQAILRSEVNNGIPIDSLLRNMNEQICKSSSAETYVTLFYGEFDTTCNVFRYANAGHNYPVLVRANGDIELLTDGGPIIGALPMMEYRSASVRLEKDDLLFFFTDGLSAAMNEKEEEYTEDRIRKFVCDQRRVDPETLINSILDDVRRFDPMDPPRDDTTIVALKVNEVMTGYERQT